MEPYGVRLQPVDQASPSRLWALCNPLEYGQSLRSRSLFAWSGYAGRAECGLGELDEVDRGVGCIENGNGSVG